jgi:NitT/TauT family transport system permease protein
MASRMTFRTITNIFFRSDAPAAQKRRPSAWLAARAELSPRKDFLIGLWGIATVLALWCLLTYSGLVKPFFLPTPSGIWEGLTEYYNRDWLLPAIWRSFFRVTKALLLVILIGIPIGVLMGALKPVDAFLRKLINGAKSVPTTGLLGLVVLWVGLEERGKIVFLFLGAIFYMIILVKNAVSDVNDEYVRVALDVGANQRQVIRHVLFWGALPQIWQAIAVCNGIMWTYIVLTEFINSNEEQLGLGYLLYIGSRTQQSGKVFGSLIIIALISSLTDFLLQLFREKFLNW